jgi:hypothetical protein
MLHTTMTHFELPLLMQFALHSVVNRVVRLVLVAVVFWYLCAYTTSIYAFTYLLVHNARRTSRHTHKEHTQTTVGADMYIKIQSGTTHTAMILAVSSACLYCCGCCCCFTDSTIHKHTLLQAR